MKTSLFIFLVVLSQFFSDYLFADNLIVQGEVSGEWNVDTVMVIDNIYINEGETLIIHAGTLILFQGHYALDINGNIHAIGNAESPVIFSINDTTGFAYDSIPDGGWFGIRFDFPNLNTDSSFFEYCQFFYGKAVPALPSKKEILTKSDSCGGAIYISGFDKVRISNCRFENNYAGFNGGTVYLDSANIIIQDCHFIDNKCGMMDDPWGYGGAICSDNGEPVIWNSYFQGNQSTGVGGAIAIRFKDGKIGNCIFTENQSALGGAFGFLHIEQINHTNCNNLIYNNMADFFGGGIANVNASPVYLNHTIVNNNAMYGGAFYCKDPVTPILFNSILWGNTAWSGTGPEVYLFEPYSQANFYYCDVAGGPDLFGGSGGGGGFTGQYYETIDMDPEFAINGYHAYELASSSPCINTGVPDTTGLNFPPIDILGLPRIMFGRIDMGSYESALVGFNNLSKEINLSVHCYPNPSSGITNIHYKIPGTRFVKLDLFDSFGRKIESIVDDYQDMGEYIVGFDASLLNSGIYIYSLSTGDQIIKGKIVVK